MSNNSASYEVLKAREILFNKLMRNASIVCDYIKEHVDDVIEVGIFGSLAREDFNACSDSDVYLVTKERIERHIRGDIRCFAEENNCDVVFFTIDNFNSKYSLLASNINKERKILYK